MHVRPQCRWLVKRTNAHKAQPGTVSVVAPHGGLACGAPIDVMWAATVSRHRSRLRTARHKGNALRLDQSVEYEGAAGLPLAITTVATMDEHGLRAEPITDRPARATALPPGEAARHYGGRTTEVTNTDAEGRVVMADALAYAVAELDPAVLVDVATLTGAMKVALGQQVGGYFANDEALAAVLADAGETAGEPLWRFPLASVYEEKLASKVADADNAPGGPGAITAALFLQHFVGDVPWAHLDIASVGDSPEDSHEWTAGPTGFGARALLGWLGSDDPLAGVRRTTVRKS